jgi:hypothetical protein
METWNREELYAEVWEQPLVKVAPQYGISAVMLGKVCHKLQIPLPGRGYWTKKEFGKPVERLPLPCEGPPSHTTLQTFAQEAPTDAEFLRIVDVESRKIVIDPDAPLYKMVKTTGKCLHRTKLDEKASSILPITSRAWKSVYPRRLWSGHWHSRMPSFSASRRKDLRLPCCKQNIVQVSQSSATGYRSQLWKSSAKKLTGS